MRERALLASLILLACPAFAQSDDCAAPPPIVGTGSFAFSMLFATGSGFDGGGGAAGCSTTAARDLFWTWNAPAAGTYSFSLCGAGFNSQLSLHSGVDCGALCLAYDDNNCGSQAAIEVTLPAGEPVLIQVGNLFNAPNSGDLEITLLPPPPASDDCAAPIQISGIGSTPYSRTGLTSSGFDGGNPAACSQGTAGPVIRDLFFAWTALADGSYRFLSCGEMGSVVLTAHQGSDCSATCITDSIGYPCSFAGEEVLMHGVLTGDMVLLQLGDWDSFAVYPTGGILEVETAPLPPTNDACSSPTAASGLGSFPYDSSTSTDSGFDGNGAAPCVGVNHNRDVFFVWTATANGDFQFDTVGTSANTRMSIYDGADCSATCIDFDEDSADGVSPRIDLMGMIAGDTVLVQIGGWNASSVGPGALNVSIPLPPSTNDTCATAETLSGVGSFPYAPVGTTTTLFDGGSPSCLPGFSGIPVWDDLFYQWSAPMSGSYTIRIVGQDAALNLHAGDGCSATCLESDLVNPNITLVNLAEGDPILIQVGEIDPGAGPNTLIIECASACSPISVLCDPASDHFQGDYVKLNTSYHHAFAGSPFHIDATDGPSGEFGFVLVSATPNAGMNVLNGVLCLDLPMGRYNPQIATNQGLPQLNSLGQFDGAGEFQNISGSAPSTGGRGFDVPFDLPFSPAGQSIQSGETWYFQVWYRDVIVTPGDSANFSNLIGVVFP
tara:strand:- start:1090 stop:3252 length:2163 start_codon:yes stop_codon:yes gene_type:complete